ncbi:MAG: hypothetical protein CEE38_08730 [Planctomycetes bacterium B3_Pla]|nr:MAG: hypothetical protein CEE38_08730 [Planctomycetes bacterium B3_Pla]
MSSRSGHIRQRVLLSSLTAIVWLAGSAQAREVTISSRITYEIREGLYVDKGSDDGLRQGLFGSVRFDDGQVLGFEVLHAAEKSALLRLTGPAKNERLAGQTVELVFEHSAPDQESKTEDGKSSTNKDDDKFTPLLAPAGWTVGLPKSSNISHGQIRIRQMLQKDNEGLLDYSMTRLGSSGSLDKIEGSRWSFEWSGDLAYRDGYALRYHPDYQDPRLDLYMASFHRPLGEGGFLRFGRFLPRELPGIGYVDGFQGQIRRADHWYLGAVAGFKPDRDNLDPSGHEPLVAAYATLKAGNRDGRYYLGTAGLLGSLYRGQADRLALLIDQRAGVGSSLNLYSTAEVDFDVGGAETRNGTRLTRLDVSAVSRVSSFITLRAGLDHWERADNRAERDLLVIEDDRLFDRGFWRYWLGSDQGLPWNLRLSEQVAFIDSPDYDYDPRWRIGLTRMGLLSWPAASVTATIYNFDAQNLDGYGGRLSAYLPLIKHKLFIQPVAGFRMLEAKPQSSDFEVSYLSLRVNGRLSSTWTLFGGFTHTYGDSIDSTLLDLGLRYRW